MRLTNCLAPLLSAVVLFGSPWAEARTDVCYQGGVLLPNFRLNGNAQLDGNSLLITPDQSTQNSSAMFRPTFGSTGDLHIELKLQLSTAAGSGGEGMAFVMHRDTRGPAALGNGGGGIGYGKNGTAADFIIPSLIVEMDTKQNGTDLNGNHIAITRNGDEAAHLQSFTPSITMSGGTPFWVWVDYTASMTKLDVSFSTTATKPAVPDITDSSTDLNTLFNGQPFYMGFTGATGATSSKHQVISFIASDSAVTSTVCCSADEDCLPLSASNNLKCDPQKKVCGACTATDSNACLDLPAGCDVGAAMNTCIPVCNGDFGATVTNPCPSAGAPYCVTGGPQAGSCIACNGNSGSGATLACAASTPSCSPSGFCGWCTGDSDCTFSCDTVSHACRPCNGDNGSTATRACPSSAAPYCDAGGQCTACKSDASCAGAAHTGPVCTNGACTRCSADFDCFGASHAGPACNTTTGTCARCSTDVDCAGSAHFGAYCAASGSCGTCSQDSDCSGASHGGPFCQTLTGEDIPTGSCTACQNDAECLGAAHGGPLCDDFSGTCGNACSTDDQCKADQWCNVSGTRGSCAVKLVNGVALPATCTPLLGSRACQSGVCSKKTDTCGECTTDSDCGPGALCHQNVCSNRCANNTQCAETEWCNDSAGPNGACEVKVQPGQPLPDALGGCTPALAVRACQSGLCRKSDNTCVECLTNNDCPNGSGCSPENGCLSTTLAGGGIGCDMSSNAETSAGRLSIILALATFAGLLLLRRRRHHHHAA